MELFARSNRGAEPTAAAYALLNLARGVLSDLDGIATQMRDYRAGVRGHVRVVANISAITQFLPDEFQRFMAAHPQVEVRLQEKICTPWPRPWPRTRPTWASSTTGGYGEGVTLLPYREDELILIGPRGPRAGAAQAVRCARPWPTTLWAPTPAAPSTTC